MKTKLILLALLISAGFLSTARAQSADAFKMRLAQPDSLTQARVKVTEVGTAARAVRSMPQTAPDDKITGYRVTIFFDNSQSARTMAAGTLTRFRELYPEIPAYMVYENPYFKVSVGNCLSAEEAIILLGRVKGSFDRAFMAREKFPISCLAE